MNDMTLTCDSSEDLSAVLQVLKTVEEVTEYVATPENIEFSSTLSVDEIEHRLEQKMTIPSGFKIHYLAKLS